MMRSNRMIWSLGVLLLILVLSACGGQVPATESIPEPTATEPASAAEPTATVAPVPSPTVASTEVVVASQPTIPGSPDPGPEPLIEHAKLDLAERLSLPIDQIEVLETQSVVWPDASLGCPQPGMMYAQVLTPGFEIALEAEGQEFNYHTDSDRLVVLCADQPQAPLDLPAGSRLPIFVELVQSPLSPDSPAQMPPADTSPTGVFAFDPVSRLLSVQSSVQILPTTEVLVGLTTAKVPNRPYVATGLFQVPSSQATPLSVIAIDADSDTVTLAYADQTFELRPGESLSFKQKGAGELPTIELTTIINHGRPAAIGVLPADPGSR